MGYRLITNPESIGAIHLVGVLLSARILVVEGITWLVVESYTEYLEGWWGSVYIYYCARPRMICHALKGTSAWITFQINQFRWNMTESSNSASDSIVCDESFLKSLLIYLITLGGIQSAIVDIFHSAISIFGVIAYWPYFFLSIYMAKNFSPRSLFSVVFCIVIGTVLSVLISTYGKRFVWWLDG